MILRDDKLMMEAYAGRLSEEKKKEPTMEVDYHGESYFNQMPDDKEFECTECDVHFDDEEEYSHHLNMVHDINEATELDGIGSTATVTADGDKITIKFSKNTISGNAKDIEAFINKVHAEVLTYVDKEIYG